MSGDSTPLLAGRAYGCGASEQSALYRYCVCLWALCVVCWMRHISSPRTEQRVSLPRLEFDAGVKAV